MLSHELAPSGVSARVVLAKSESFAQLVSFALIDTSTLSSCWDRGSIQPRDGVNMRWWWKVLWGLSIRERRFMGRWKRLPRLRPEAALRTFLGVEPSPMILLQLRHTDLYPLVNELGRYATWTNPTVNGQPIAKGIILLPHGLKLCPEGSVPL